jgi:hypothetical protein
LIQLKLFEWGALFFIHNNKNYYLQIEKVEPMPIKITNISAKELE